MITINMLLPRARQRLIVVSDAAPVVEAARLLGGPQSSLVVVCGLDGRVAGVVTKADVVREISTCTGCSCTAKVSNIMTRDVVACSPDQPLAEVWEVMKKNALRQLPVNDEESRPLGVLYANDALEALLSEVEHEETLLRDYVMGIGYR